MLFKNHLPSHFMYCAQRRSSRAFGCFDDDKDGSHYHHHDDKDGSHDHHNDDKDGSHYHHLVNHPLHDDPMGVEHGSRLVHLPGRGHHDHGFCLPCPPTISQVFLNVLLSMPIAPNPESGPVSKWSLTGPLCHSKVPLMFPK